jgi:ribosomal protein S11
MAKGKKEGTTQREEGPKYQGPRVREGEKVFGVAHIYASFNDTFVVRVVQFVQLIVLACD